jgi:para-nitrobenzyl esterase
MPVQRWSGVREATAFGPMCAQASTPVVRNAAEISKEDCLYLNVWTPEWPVKSRLPVMVWIPGGGNFMGSSDHPTTEGESLAARGVVVVSLNYRLATLGFFSHPELTRESRHHASGNQGILDQIAALEWVKANIAKFGGDLKNVTIFGNSAGSLNVSVLMTTPLSKNLFHRAIGQSGPVILVGDPLTLAQAEERGVKLSDKWNLPREVSPKALRAVPLDVILSTQPNYLRPPPPPNLGVTVDGYVFPRQPAAVFAAGKQHRVPLLLGNTSRDVVPGSIPPKDLNGAMHDAYGPLAARAERLYAGPADPVYGTPTDQWRTDTSFRCASVAQLVWHAAAGNPAFEYEFARVPEGRESVGATHAFEISYVFGTLDRGVWAIGPPSKLTTIDRQISDTMQQYWVNFARTGNPNGAELPRWPTFTPSARAYLQFTDTGAVAKEGLRRDFCDLFIDNVKRSMATATAGSR